jgi:hypothetical protein
MKWQKSGVDLGVQSLEERAARELKGSHKKDEDQHTPARSETRGSGKNGAQFYRPADCTDSVAIIAFSLGESRVLDAKINGCSSFADGSRGFEKILPLRPLLG